MKLKITIIVVSLIACVTLTIFMISSSISYRKHLSNAKVEKNLMIGDMFSELIVAIINRENNTKIQDPKNIQNLNTSYSFNANSDVDSLVSALTKLFPSEKIKIRLYDEKSILVIESNRKKEIDTVAKEKPDHFSDKLFIGIYQLINKFINYQNEVLFKQIESIYDEDVYLRKTIYPEVVNALSGYRGAIIRYDNDGNSIINVAMPLQSSGRVRGVLLITDKDNKIYVEFIRIELARSFTLFICLFLTIIILFLIGKTHKDHYNLKIFMK